MKSSSQKNPAPVGYSTICPYLLVDNIEKQSQFLKDVFHAEVMKVSKDVDGKTYYAEVRIGDTVLLMAQPDAESATTHCMMYLFTENVNEVYERALEHGATSLMQPVIQFYSNNKEAGIIDPQGNQWWIAQQVRKPLMRHLDYPRKRARAF